MKLISRFLSVVIVLGTLVALCVPADAGAYLYAGKRKKVYCGVVEIVDPLTGVVLNDAQISALHTTPINAGDRPIPLFAKLDAMNNMKPAGWTLENPLAATQDKLDPYYWRVRVASARNLSRMNMLYLPGSGNLPLSDAERENLRKFVDGGGVLWVDNIGAALKFPNDGPFFIGQLQFAGSATTDPDGAVSRHHPLLCCPYWLTDMEIMNLGTNASGGARSRVDLGIFDPQKPPSSYSILFPIVDTLSGGNPSVVANTYGSGRVVATANAVGMGCLLYEPYSMPSLKFAFNIMSYSSTWTDIRKDPRHSGASIDTVGSNKLVEKWYHVPSAVSTNNRESAALIYKNTVFYTSGSTLYALEQNGDTVGGLYTPHNPGGAVELWSWTDPNGASLSAPTIATVQNPRDDQTDCKPVEALLVQDTAGTVFVINAFPMNEFGVIDTQLYGTMYSFETAAGTSSADSKWPGPPIYVDGWIYAVSGKGRLYADNPCLKKNTSTTGAASPGSSPSWTCPDAGTPDRPGVPYEATPRGGPSFGYVKNPSSSAVVGMVYWFTSRATMPPPDPNSTDINDHIHGVPVSVSMDRVNMGRHDPTHTKFEVRVNYPNQNGMGAYLTAPDPNNKQSAIRILDSDGKKVITQTADPLLNQQLNSTSGTLANGWIVVSAGLPVQRNTLIYASYSLAYGTLGPAIMSDWEIEPKSPNTGPTHKETIINGTPAMGPDNMIYMCGKRTPNGTADGGSILAYQSDGGVSSAGKLRWHFFLHSGFDSGYNPGLTVSIPGVVYDSDAEVRDANTGDLITPGPSMTSPEPCSSPAVAGGKLFVTLTGTGTGPKAALACFRTNSSFTIRLTESAGFGANGKAITRPKSLYRPSNHDKYTIRLWQPNLINGPSSAMPMMDARVINSGMGSGIDIDYDNGTITFNNFGLNTKLQTMMTDTNTFSPSLPVWVWLDNIETPIDWSTWKQGALVTGSTRLNTLTSDSVDLSGWNNMLWYYIVPNHPQADKTTKECSGAHSPPVVIGSTVYFICDDGYLFALDSETGESDGKKTKQVPLWSPKVGEGASLGANSAVSVSGSNGVLMVPGLDGLHAFANTTTLVADNNRVVEVDGAGEVTWSVDSISWPAVTPYAAGRAMAIKQGPVNKPNRARYANTGEILFANSGANQVCKIDKSGTVGFEGTGGKYIRWIYEKFADPMHLLRPGQPTRLQGPTDAIMWQEMEPPASTIGGKTTTGVSVVHCLIADSGNSRLLDLVYRVANGQFVDYTGAAVDGSYIDPDNGFVMPELNWVSKTDSLNERYAYDCLQLVPVDRNGKFCQDIWAASSNYATDGTDLNSGKTTGGAGLGGAILAIGYRERTQATSSSPPSDWNYTSATSGTITAKCDHVVLESKTVPLANPKFFEVIQPDPQINVGLSLLICDNYGVYRAEINGNGPPNVINHLLAQDYYNLVRNIERDPASPVPPKDAPSPNKAISVPFKPTSAQRLFTGRWLIANSATSTQENGAVTFGGEVFEFDPDGADGEKIPWSSPRLQRPWVGDSSGGSWGLWKQITTNTYDLKQPRSAFRP